MIDVEGIATALEGMPTSAFTTPIVYPWAVQNFETRPCAERPRPKAGHQLYVHVPFCRYVCTFCFYAVRRVSKTEEMQGYVRSLERELDRTGIGEALSRLVIGGGTPSVLPPDLLDSMFRSIRARTTLPPPHRCKMEASPDSVTDAHIRVLHENGIGWVSVGVESLGDEVLSTVERKHSSEEALHACRMVSESGLRLNADLIYGLPGQSEDDFRRDLEALLAAGVTTVCLYALRLNPKTRVGRQLGPEEALDLDRLVGWRAFVHEAARSLGFTQTRSYTFQRGEVPTTKDTWDVSPAHRELLGVGMSARSQLDGTVYRNHDRFNTYLERVDSGKSPVETLFALDSQDRKTQMIARTLGDSRTFYREDYQRAFGVSIDSEFEEVLGRLRAAELIDDQGDCIVLSERGKLVYDRILMCFYPERTRAWLGAMTRTQRAPRLPVTEA